MYEFISIWTLFSNKIRSKSKDCNEFFLSFFVDVLIVISNFHFRVLNYKSETNILVHGSSQILTLSMNVYDRRCAIRLATPASRPHMTRTGLSVAHKYFLGFVNLVKKSISKFKNQSNFTILTKYALKIDIFQKNLICLKSKFRNILNTFANTLENRKLT